MIPKYSPDDDGASVIWVEGYAVFIDGLKHLQDSAC